MIGLQTAFRIGVHLPFRDVQEERAVKEITKYLKFEYDGSTYSNVFKSAFRGTWKADDGTEFEADLCLLNIDTLVEADEEGSHFIEAKASSMVSEIVIKARSFYDMVGRTQRSFWVTVTEMKISSAG